MTRLLVFATEASEAPVKNNVILALDQSTQITGWALYEDGSLKDYGKINPSGDLINRLIKMRDWVKNKAKNILNENKNLTIAIEEIQLQMATNQNVVTFKKLAYAQAILLELFTEHNIPYEIVSASTWKSKCGIKGKNRAEQKRAAQEYVKEEFGISATQDECDAICIGKSLVINNEDIFYWN